MQVTLNALPASLAEFQNLPRNTPEEVVAGFLCALHLYTKNPNEGVEAMNLLRDCVDRVRHSSKWTAV